VHGHPRQPTAYKPEYCELGHNYCLLGATNEELGSFFGVTRRTVDNWIATASCLRPVLGLVRQQTIVSLQEQSFSPSNKLSGLDFCASGR